MRAVGLAVLLMAGCAAAPRGKVEGVVRRDGKPLDNVLVTFVPDADAGTTGKHAAGVTGADGRYRLQGEDGKPGAAAGSYRVILEDLAVYDAPRDREGSVLKMPPRRFPASHGDPLQTPWRKAVAAGAQTIDLDVTGPQR